MKIHVSLKTLACSAILSVVLLSGSANGALVLHYTFEGSGASVTNEGTSGAAGNLGTFNSTDQPTDLRTGSGTGVGGNGNAINFVATPNAAGPYGITSGSVSLDITAAFTVSGWLDMTTWNSGASIWRNNSGAFGSSLLLTSNNGLQLSLGNGTSTANLNPNTNAFAGATSEGWVFFAITWDGSTVTFYRGDDDSSSSLSVVGTSAYTAGWANNTTGLFALGNTTGSDNNRPLNGLMDDFRIYNNFSDATTVNAIRLSAVPEPSVFGLIIGGVAGCLLIGRKRTRLVQ